MSKSKVKPETTIWKGAKDLIHDITETGLKPIKTVTTATAPTMQLKGMSNVLSKLDKYGGIATVLFAFIALTGLIIMFFVIKGYNRESPVEKFENELMFPKASDALDTGEFDTLNRECETGLKKCKKMLNGGNGVTYWCAPHCNDKEMHLTGVPLKESNMSWSTRFA